MFGFAPTLHNSRSWLRRASSAATLALALLVTAACDDDDDDDGPTNGSGVTGTYSVVEVTGPNGTDDSSPFLLFDGDLPNDQGGTVNVRVELVNGSITLNGNGTYTGDSEARAFVAGIPFTDFDDSDFAPGSGTWTQNGSTITFSPTGEEQFTATLSNGTLTLTESVDLDDDVTTPAAEFTFRFEK